LGSVSLLPDVGIRPGLAALLSIQILSPAKKNGGVLNAAVSFFVSYDMHSKLISGSDP
jgi:hypothetical protein